MSQQKEITTTTTKTTNIPLPSSKDFDVPLEWLYKGKRKNKNKIISNKHNNTTQTNISINSSTSSSTTSNNTSNKNGKDESTNISSNLLNNKNNSEGIHSTDKELKTQFTSLNRRSRSSSVSNALLDSSILKNRSSQISNNSSTNNNNNNNNNHSPLINKPISTQKQSSRHRSGSLSVNTNVSSTQPSLSSSSTLSPSTSPINNTTNISNGKNNISNTPLRNRSSSISNNIVTPISPNNPTNNNILSSSSTSTTTSPLTSSSSSSTSASATQQKTRRSSSNNSTNSDGRRKSLISSLFGRRNTNVSPPLSGSSSPSKQPISTTPMAIVSKIGVIDDSIDTSTIEKNIPLHVGSPDLSSSLPSSSASSMMMMNQIQSKTNNNNKNNILPTDNLPLSRSKLNNILNVPLKRVTFAVDKFDSDPPQQLPSRKPKLGNVMIPNDMISDIPSISVGISNTDSNPNLNSNSNSNNTSSSKITKDSKEFKVAMEIYNENLKEAIKHQQEAHKAAEKIAKEVKSYNNKLQRKNSLSITRILSNNSENSDVSRSVSPATNINTNTNNLSLIKTISSDGDDQNTIDMSTVNIDKPLHVHEHYFENSEPDIIQNLTLDIIYTRCCHLREILPIPSTLRQLRGKTSPLHVLKFLNPRPTLIDILSFCDFIAIVPIHNVIFDNVTLNSEMLKILLSSLVNSITLEKIGLRNVIISQNDWNFFCKFIFNNKSLTKLDISQTKTRSDLLLKDHREYMDWDLLTNVIRLRSGKPLEELLLNGVKLMHIPLPQFQNLLIVFGDTYRQSLNLIKTKYSTSSPSSSTLSLASNEADNVGIRLGLASTEITDDYLTIILNWMSQYSIQGVDLSFNNLNPFLRLMAKKFARLPYDNLQYFTLNNTNISDVTNLALLLKYLSRLPNLKFLDLSNIPAVFPGIIPYLYKYLPRFQSLKRIHIDNNNLNYRQIIMLCNILVKCNNLSHVSMLYEMDHYDDGKNGNISNKTTSNNNHGNKPSETQDDMNLGTNNTTYRHKFFTRNTVWAALYSLVRDSPNLFSLDIDYDQVSEEIQSRIALCLMRNMQHAVNSDFKIDALSSQDQLLFDGSLLAETADEVLKKLNTNTSLDEDPHLAAAKKYMLKKYLEKLDRLLEKVQETIDNVFEKRKIGELPTKEKENLLRLLLLEKNLKNIIVIVSSIPNIQKRNNNPFVDLMGNKNDKINDNTNTLPLLPAGGSRPLLKHLDSERLMAEVVGEDDHEKDPTVPHTVATESDNRIVDINTGKPVLYKSTSSTSIQSKLQEKEEGELHKWGFFIQQQRSIYPPDGSLQQPKDIDKLFDKDDYIPPVGISGSPDSYDNNGLGQTSNNSSPKFLPRIPSGDELRKAIIKAKGVATMDDLIQNVTSNKQELENIYNAAYFLTGHPKGNEPKVNPSVSK